MTTHNIALSNIFTLKNGEDIKKSHKLMNRKILFVLAIVLLCVSLYYIFSYKSTKIIRKAEIP